MGEIIDCSATSLRGFALSSLKQPAKVISLIVFAAKKTTQICKVNAYRGRNVKQTRPPDARSPSQELSV